MIDALDALRLHRCFLFFVHTATCTFTSRSQDQMWAQAAELRRKYDDLVSFTINLTAEKVSGFCWKSFGLDLWDSWKGRLECREDPQIGCCFSSCVAH